MGLDTCTGLDSEINELVEGSDIYEPRVELSQVRRPTCYSVAALQRVRYLICHI